MKGSDLNHAELASTVSDRMRELGLNQRELAARSGVGIATLRRIQHGDPLRYGQATLAALSRALGLPDQQLYRIFRGETPAEEGAGDSDVRVRLDAIDAELRDISQRLRNLETPR